MRSPVPLWSPLATGDEFDIDVTIRSRREIPQTPPPGALVCEHFDDDFRYYTATRTDAGYVFRFHDTCDVEISPDLRTVRCFLSPDTDDEYLSVLLPGTVTAFLLLLKGVCLLHASAIAVDGRAVAFVGNSGIGKSTLAASLCASGAELVTDDVLRLDLGDEVVCARGPSEIRLRETALDLAARLEISAPTRTTADERTAVTPSRRADSFTPLQAIVLPRPVNEASSLRVERIAPVDLVVRLAEHPRLAGWYDPDVHRSSFRNLAEVARRVPAYDAEVPWGANRDRVARELVRAVGLR